MSFDVSEFVGNYINKKKNNIVIVEDPHRQWNTKLTQILCTYLERVGWSS